jgi:dihydrofolate synthase / folylpolyglutamate synthase
MKPDETPAYSQALEFLYSLRLFGAKFGLENTLELAARMGNPQARLRFIHVAGTNGKGSTCAMLEGIYRASGLRVGLFTSPHLVSFRERLQVNRRLIAEAEVVQLLAELKPALESFPPGHHPTFFEVVAVMALKFFEAQKCDLVIWETGLGGRLDATNIVTPLASVITNIALDHQQWLGETLAEIAAEKAGIIKSGVSAFTAVLEPAALEVILGAAQKKHSPLTRVTPDQVAALPYAVALPGEHQKWNAALALAVVAGLQPQLPVTPEAIQSGLATAHWPGRLQRLVRPGGQQIILDGAHNLAGAEVLRRALEVVWCGQKMVFIFGALADKKWLEICRILAPLASEVFAVPVASERAAAAAELAAGFQQFNPACRTTVAENVADALNACKDRPLVVVTGSLYLVGEALECLEPVPSGGAERALNEWTAPLKKVISFV